MPADTGMGLLTGVGEYPLCAIDLDTLAPEVAELLTSWCFTEIGPAPVRVGKAPKALLLYRASEPGWRKQSTPKYRSTDDLIGDQTHQIEILGAGQQFVAYGTHPDTGAPYAWGKSGAASPEENPARELTRLTQSDIERLFTRFESLATEKLASREWEACRKSSPKAKVKASSALIDTDPLDNYEPPMGATHEQLKRWLDELDPNDYQLWTDVGMALYHETEGSVTCLALWDAWSALGSTYQGPEETEAKWTTFEADLASKPRTARSLKMWAQEAHKARTRDAKLEVHKAATEQINQCLDTHALLEDTAPEIWQKTKGDEVTRGELPALLQARYKTLTGSHLPIAAARRALRQGAAQKLAPVAAGSATGALPSWSNNCPPWARGWVYAAELDVFCHLTSRSKISAVAFRMKFDPMVAAIDEEESNAVRYVQMGQHIPVVDRLSYLPACPSGILLFEKAVCANTYSTAGQAVIPADLTDPSDAQAAALFRRHIELFFGAGQWTRETQLMANFLRHQIEFPGRKVNWAVLLQGDEGDGKSLLLDLMAGLLGRGNVRSLAGSTVAASSNFTGWAVGQCFTLIEEVRIEGHNRYNVMNTLKPPVSNSTIEVHPKGVDPYNIPNTTNYILTTNHGDGIPLSSNDRRYLVFFSTFPLERLQREEPDYFGEITAAVLDRPGAIGRWLLDVDWHEDFKPKGRAPMTEDKTRVIAYTKGETQEILEDLLEASKSPYFDNQAVSFSELKDAALFENHELNQRQIQHALQHMGFYSVGRVRLRGLEGARRLWARKVDGAVPPAEVVKRWIEQKVLVEELV